MTNRKRLDGYYKVRRFHDEPEPSIALWAFPGRWYTCGDTTALNDDAFAAIDETPVLLKENPKCE